MDERPGVPDVVTSFVGFFVAVGLALGVTAILADKPALLLFSLVSFAFAVSSVVLGHRGRARAETERDSAADELEIAAEPQIVDERI